MSHRFAKPPRMAFAISRSTCGIPSSAAGTGILTRTGIPEEHETKHGHGIAYAISACAACHELTGETDCLDLAKSAFAWLEANARDREHGGYFVFYKRDGTPILAKDQDPASEGHSRSDRHADRFQGLEHDLGFAEVVF